MGDPCILRNRRTDNCEIKFMNTDDGVGLLCPLKKKVESIDRKRIIDIKHFMIPSILLLVVAWDSCILGRLLDIEKYKVKNKN